MDISLLIHECSRRGVTFEAEGRDFRILASPGEIDDGFRSIISAHKAEIAAHFAVRSDEFSPPDALFSPLSPQNSPSGLNVNPLSIRDTDSFSPLSPQERGEELRVWGTQNQDRGEHKERDDFIPACNDSPLRDSGLSGLNQRNSLLNNKVTTSPCIEKRGLNGGLNAIQVDCAGLRLPVPPTWETLSLQRWGPAMDEDRPWVVAEDDEPGIVIDTPDRGRMMAALRSRTDGGLTP